MGAVPVLGFTRSKSEGASAKQRSESLMVSVSWRKKAHSVSWNRRSAPPNTRAQNLNRESTSGKKGGSPRSESSILEVEQPGHAAAGGDGLEEVRSRLVGVDAGGREQPDESVRLDQPHGALDEQRIEVDVAAAQQGIVPGRANQLAQLIRSLLRGVEFVRQRRSLVTQLLNACFPCGRCRGQGQLR